MQSNDLVETVLNFRFDQYSVNTNLYETIPLVDENISCSYLINEYSYLSPPISFESIDQSQLFSPKPSNSSSSFDSSVESLNYSLFSSTTKNSNKIEHVLKEILIGKETGLVLT